MLTFSSVINNLHVQIVSQLTMADCCSLSVQVFPTETAEVYQTVADAQPNDIQIFVHALSVN